LCGPDAGSGKRVKRMKEQLAKYHNIHLNYVMLDKTRRQANVIDEMVIIGDVKGKHVIILDDMVDTAGTLCKAAEVLIDAGAKSVRAIISHGVLSGNAFVNIGDSKLTELVVSNSLPKQDSFKVCAKNYSEEDCFKIKKAFDKITYKTIAKQIGFVMAALNNNMSYEMLKSIKKVK
jgi:ribose-phosphate pyrophosphokinase